MEPSSKTQAQVQKLSLFAIPSIGSSGAALEKNAKQQDLNDNNTRRYHLMRFLDASSELPAPPPTSGPNAWKVPLIISERDDIIEDDPNAKELERKQMKGESDEAYQLRKRIKSQVQKTWVLRESGEEESQIRAFVGREDKSQTSEYVVLIPDVQNPNTYKVARVNQWIDMRKKSDASRVQLMLNNLKKKEFAETRKRNELSKIKTVEEFGVIDWQGKGKKKKAKRNPNQLSFSSDEEDLDPKERSKRKFIEDDEILIADREVMGMEDTDFADLGDANEFDDDDDAGKELVEGEDLGGLENGLDKIVSAGSQDDEFEDEDEEEEEEGWGGKEGELNRSVHNASQASNTSSGGLGVNAKKRPLLANPNTIARPASASSTKAKPPPLPPPNRQKSPPPVSHSAKMRQGIVATLKRNPQGLSPKSLVEALRGLNLIRADDAGDLPLVKELVVEMCRVTKDEIVNEKILTLKPEFA